MRVIAGKYRGKILSPPQNKNFRPTTDRIKETMFNILVSKGVIQDAVVLDLFCGSGALGIEALSRGAKSVIFNDAGLKSIAVTKKNLDVCGIKAQVMSLDYSFALKKLKDERFDLIFIDPPYDETYATKLFDLINEYEILRGDGVIVFEHYVKKDLQFLKDRFIIDNRACGNTALSFLTLKDKVLENSNEEK
ncbi:MAG: 16S rRNA (guanine(966)-N(2))-methyltransferase RsmD [Firmicutes bacterium]|nr:16S rRNA (guanine(966)-N(2))-methyltransferase RsmD [Bacillota bacterium]MCL2256046.1 16S rRNA (guanine(966)-N(2))-methyltransferase RsmD [Bacillota bacterium]